MSDLRIGVIGSGGRGDLAGEAHRPGKGSRIVACCDRSEKTLARNRERYGADIFTTDDYRRLLEQELDAVFVCTPDFLHEEHALAALQRGIGVYLEKPMAITVAGCDRILEAARANDAALYLGHNMRHFPVVQKMKQLIEDGAIGEPQSAWCRHFISYGGDAYFKDWHAERKRATSLLLQKGAHDIDVLHWLCRGYTQEVSAMGGLMVYDRIQDRHGPEERGDASWSMDNWPPLSQKGLNPVIDVEDLSMMLMRLDNGVIASYQQCHFTPDAWRNYTVIGTEGRIENFGDHGKEAVVRLWNKRHHYHPSGDHEFGFEDMAGGHGGSDTRIVEEFLGFLRGGPATTSPVAARYSVAAGCLAADSLRDGARPRQVPRLDPALEQYFAQRCAGTARR